MILITNGAPNGLFTLLDTRFAQHKGADPWLIADEYKKQGITLAIVGIEPGVQECAHFYCALARKTGIKKLFILFLIIIIKFYLLILGGHYIPFEKAENILSAIFRSVILNENSFCEAFSVEINKIEQHSLFNYTDMQQHPSFGYSALEQLINTMLSKCENMSDIQNFFFNYHQC